MRVLRFVPDFLARPLLVAASNGFHSIVLRSIKPFCPGPTEPLDPSLRINWLLGVRHRCIGALAGRGFEDRDSRHQFCQELHGLSIPILIYSGQYWKRWRPCTRDSQIMIRKTYWIFVKMRLVCNDGFARALVFCF